MLRLRPSCLQVLKGGVRRSARPSSIASSPCQSGKKEEKRQVVRACSLGLSPDRPRYPLPNVQCVQCVPSTVFASVSVSQRAQASARGALALGSTAGRRSSSLWMSPSIPCSCPGCRTPASRPSSRDTLAHHLPESIGQTIAPPGDQHIQVQNLNAWPAVCALRLP